MGIFLIILFIVLIGFGLFALIIFNIIMKPYLWNLIKGKQEDLYKGDCSEINEDKFPRGPEITN